MWGEGDADEGAQQPSEVGDELQVAEGQATRGAVRGVGDERLDGGDDES